MIPQNKQWTFNVSLKHKLYIGITWFTAFATILASIWFWPTGSPNKPLFKNFSELVISAAHAEDNFTLKPAESDSLGASSDSAYILTSKESIEDAELIKKNITLDPAVPFKIETVSSTEWKIVPGNELPANTILKVGLEAAYTDSEGSKQARDFSWAYQIKDSFKVLSSIPRNATTEVPLNTGIEITLSHDNFSGFEKYFKLTPEVAGRFEKRGRTIVFIPKDELKPRSLYTATLKKGLGVLESDDVLLADYNFTFETAGTAVFPSENAPWFSVFDKMIELGTKNKPQIQVNAMNLEEKIQVSAFKIPDAEEFAASLKRRDNLPWWADLKNDWLEKTDKLAKVMGYGADIIKNGNVEYIEFPAPLAPGFYLIELKAAGRTEQVWLESTDLSAYLNISKTDSLVWVNDVSAKSPVDGADIKMIGEPAEAKTKADGTASFATPQALIKSSENPDNPERFYLHISKDDKELIIPAGNSMDNFGYFAPERSDDYWRYLYTDRPLYQPTDKINFWGIARLRSGKKLEGKLTASLYKEGYVDYYYQPVMIKEIDATLDVDGMFSDSLEFKNLKPDYYLLELKDGKNVVKRNYIEIRNYTKPAYKITLIPDKREAYADEQVNLTATASFFEGTPVPNLDLVYKTPDGDQKVKTDENGQVKLQFTKKYFKCSEGYNCWPDTEWLSVRPEQAELADITGDAYLAFYGPSAYLERDYSYPGKGKAEIKFTSRKIKLNQDVYAAPELAPNVKLEGEVFRVTHQKKETGTYYDFISKKSYKQYEWTQKEEKADSFSAMTDNEGNFVFRRNIEPETSYKIKIKAFDERGRFDLYTEYLYYHDGNALDRYSGENFSYYHLDLPENKTYSVGEKVEAVFLNNKEKMPDGNSRYLFFKMQNGLMSYELANSSKFSFDFSSADIPNVNLGGVYFNGDSYIVASPGYFAGAAQYKVQDKELSILVDANKDRYRPGEEAKLNVFVKDKDGNPVSANVNLNLIDEALYAVMEDTATPLETLYAAVGDGSLFSLSTHTAIFDRGGGAEKGGCFAAGTKILMNDGSEKNIEEIKAGEEVSTFDNPLDRKMTAGRVEKTFKHLVSGLIVINGKTKVTPDHLIFANGRFKPARDLKRGDFLLGSGGEPVKVESIGKLYGSALVYNLRIDPQHTFFADGFFVHNEKGGGPREFFTDAALFKSVKTGADGKAETAFKLPDNLTSWRITAQAIGTNLEAGATIAALPVSLPVFADAAIGKEYLASDKPIARLRAFGSALAKDDAAEFTVSAPDMGVQRSDPIAAKAFSSAYYPLPELKAGQFSITYSLKTAKGEDSIKLPVSVVNSRLSSQSAESQKLSAGFKIKNEGKPVVAVISDLGENYYYAPLNNLLYSWGDRVDEKLARKWAAMKLNSVYQEKNPVPEFNRFSYQLSSGGVALLPYSSEDLEVSAQAAIAGADEFDAQALKQYFYPRLEGSYYDSLGTLSTSTKEEVTLALAGLAALGEPVLPRLNSWLERKDFSLKEKLYLSIAAHSLGADELGRGIYKDAIAGKITKKEPVAYIQAKTPAETYSLTALSAACASFYDYPERDGLWNYINRTDNPETLVNFEKIAFIGSALKNLRPGRVKVSYEFVGRAGEADLTGGQIKAFYLEPQEIDGLKFTKVEGEAGISVRTEKPLDMASVKRDSDIGIKREYFIGGKPAGKIHENDTIEIRLYPAFSDKALEGEYQLTDILPSGLVPVTSVYYSDRGFDCNYWYPYDVDGQKVSFKLSKNWRSGYCAGDFIKYYARVRTRGSYASEPALLQSFENPDLINFSSSGKIEIGE
jgi:hypothetical protein